MRRLHKDQNIAITKTERRTRALIKSPQDNEPLITEYNINASRGHVKRMKSIDLVRNAILINIGPTISPRLTD